MKKLFIILILFVPCAGWSVGTTGGQILKVTHAARDKALAEAVTADVPEISSFAYNPGGLTDIKMRQISATYFRWLADINFGSLAYSQSLGQGVISGNLNYWGMNEFTQFDENGVEMDQSLQYSGLAVSAGYGRKIIPDLSAGIKLKYYSETLMANTCNFAGLDIGAQYKLRVPSLYDQGEFLTGKHLTLGMQVQNLGMYINNFADEQAPMAVMIGAHYQAYKVEKNVFFLNINIQEYFSELPNFGFGVEWSFIDLLFVRGGYLLTLEKSLNSFTAGAGVKYLLTSSLLTKLDYGLAAAGDLGYTHFISLSVFFPTKGQASMLGGNE